ncbi:MAG: DUF1292 domain-containing protein [Clostridia bacterium]|nr:DUF1292 domain-containing protein [Clostridia bacterium]
MEEMSLVSKLLDEDNVDNIFLYDENDNEVEFEQIAIIPYTMKDENGQSLETRLYCILKPVDEVEGVGEDEAIVFRIYEEAIDGEDGIEVEEDIEIAEIIFEEYYKLFEE